MLTSIASPVQTQAARPSHVAGFVVFWDDGTSARTWLRDYQGYAETYFDTALLMTPHRVVDQIPSWVAGFVQRHHVQSQICVANDPGPDFDGAMLHELLTSPADEQAVIAQLVHLVQGTPFDGINVDFENGDPSDAQSFASFLGQLHGALAAVHKTLSVSVPAETYGDYMQPWNSGYDYGAIARNVDAVLIMSYDYSYQGGPPGPIAPLGWVSHVLKYASATIPRGKLQFGLPAYAYDWRSASPYPSTNLTLPQVDTWLRQHPAVTPRWNEAAEEPYITYTDAKGRQHYIGYEDARSTRYALDFIGRYRIPMVFFWYVGSENEPVYQTLESYGG